jgi:DNA primase
MTGSSSGLASSKAGADIVRIIGETLALHRRGRDWVGLCPFHAEGTASFTVFSAGHYHCFGCGVHGAHHQHLHRSRR